MKVAIVGCGNIAGVHIRYILKTPCAQLVALCDLNELRAQQMAKKYRLPHYTDLGKMLAEIRPDVVHVLTPPQTHAVLAIQALEAGCHVLLEKPLCLTTQEADVILSASRRGERLVGVDHSLLWFPLIQRAMRIVASGSLGRVIHVGYTMGDDFLEAGKEGYGRWALGLRGGIFCDLIPHPLYLIRAFLPDARVVSARACGTDIADLHELWVDFAARGSGANLWMSLNQRPLVHSLRIYCARGELHVDLRNFCLAVVPERGLPGPVARVVNTLSGSWQRGVGMLGNMLRLPLGRFDPKAGVRGAISAFYNAVKGGDPSPVSPADARAVVELSTVVWDLLENVPQAIQPSLDEHGAVIAHRRVEDFSQGAEEKVARTLVTGGTGFIGGRLVRRLVSRGRRVRVLFRPSSRLDGLPTEGVELALGDVTDASALRRAMHGIDILYHLAATMSGDRADHKRGTVEGTRKVLDAAVKAGVRKVVYVSSLGVLNASSFPSGRSVDESFSVERRPEVRGDYSRAKLEAELIAREYAESGRLDLCVLRPGLVYGDEAARFLTDAGFQVSNGLVLVVGLGGRLLGLNYVENLVDALLLAERSERSTGRVYHIVDADQSTVRRYIRTYRQVTGGRLHAIYLPAIFWLLGLGCLDVLLRLLRGSWSHLVYRIRSIARGPRFDTARAREELGWVSQISFEEGMSRTFVQEEDGRVPEEWSGSVSSCESKSLVPR